MNIGFIGPTLQTIAVSLFVCGFSQHMKLKEPPTIASNPISKHNFRLKRVT